jgi:hypothetical protein
MGAHPVMSARTDVAEDSTCQRREQLRDEHALLMCELPS